jgi:hypothetical protein
MKADMSQNDPETVTKCNPQRRVSGEDLVFELNGKRHPWGVLGLQPVTVRVRLGGR